MSRTADWAEWRARPFDGREAARLSQRLSIARRAGSSRTRSAEDVAIITRMMLVEIDRRISEGRLVRLGPREYVLRVGKR